MQAIGLRVEVIVALIALVVLTALLLVTGVQARKTHQRDKHLSWRERKDCWKIALFAVVVTSFVTVPVAGSVLVPFNTAYWLDYETKGVLTSVSQGRIDTYDNKTATTFAVKLDTSDAWFTTTDVRLTQMQGKPVTLKCTRNWSPNAADVYNCVLR